MQSRGPDHLDEQTRHDAEVSRAPSLRRAIRHYLPDIVYGANDGIITTFAVVAGTQGAALVPRIALILGFAGLFADAFSMGASNYLASSSRVEVRAPPDRADAARHGIVTFLSFIIWGSVPLLAYIVPIPTESRFSIALVLTLLTLFIVGASRALVTPVPWLHSGLEMLLVGAAAAGVAYGVGALVSVLTGGQVGGTV